MNLDSLQFIFAFFLAIPLWKLYHKVFIVLYRDVFWGIFAELAAAYLTGYILVGILFQALGSVFVAMFHVLSLVLRVVLGILGISLIGMLIAFLLFLKRQKLNPFSNAYDTTSDGTPEDQKSGFFWSAAHFIHLHKAIGAVVMVVTVVVSIFCLKFALTEPAPLTQPDIFTGEEVVPAIDPATLVGIYCVPQDIESPGVDVSIVNLYLENDILYGDWYRYCNLEGDWYILEQCYSREAVLQDTQVFWFESNMNNRITFQNEKMFIGGTTAHLINLSNGILDQNGAVEYLKQIFSSNGLEYHEPETEEEYRTRVESELYADMQNLVDRANDARNELVAYYASYGIEFPEHIQPLEYYDILNENQNLSNETGLPFDVIQDMLLNEPDISTEYGYEVWDYMCSHDYPYRIDEREMAWYF